MWSPRDRGGRLSLVAAIAAALVASGARAQHTGHQQEPQRQQQPPHQHPWLVPPPEDARKNPVPRSGGSVSTGRALYTEHCAVCHGSAGKGDGPAMPPLPHARPDLTGPPVQRQTDGALFWKITTGNPPMPGWETLPAADRWHLVNYLRRLADGRSASP